MKKAGKIPAIVSIAILTAGVAAAALGYMALRLARHEQGMRNAEIKSSVSAQAELLSRNCRLLLEQRKQKLIEVLAGAKPNQNGLSNLRFSSPFVAEAFIADRNGSLLMPRKDQVFNRRFYSLFFEAVSSTHREGKQYAVQTSKVSGKSGGLFGKFERISRPQLTKGDYVSKSRGGYKSMNNAIEMPRIEPPQMDGKGRMTSRFGRLSIKKSSGWIPWFSDNAFRPVVWALSRNDRSKLIGAEVETIALLARIQMLMPRELSPNWRLEVIDGSDKLVCAAGWTAKNDANGENGAVCVASYPIWREDFPGWRVRACLAPGWNSGAIFTVTAVTQILSLLLVIITAGFVMLYLMRRELELAGQKTSFVANVSHELKTPLTSIRMYAEMLSTHQQQLTEDKRNRYLSIILSESERLSRLITNVLDFSRTEAGRKKYHSERFSVNEVIYEINEIWAGEMVAAGVELTTEVPTGNILVMMDRDALFQGVHNLLSNALKYAASGGKISLVCHTDANDRIIIEVRDRGPGIPATSSKRIFNKFYRCDDSLTAETSGSGLGLSIARRLMRDQGGNLIYLPREGGGSIFRIILGGTK
jgi:two-component system, OmpR family, phosphate regulon sensor histidine kinase PhoR